MWPGISTRPVSPAIRASSRASSRRVASGFSTSTCLSASSARARKRVVGLRRGRHDHGLHGGVLEHRVQLAHAPAPRGGGGRTRRSRAGSLSHSARSSQLRALGDVAREVRPPVAVADDRDADRRLAARAALGPAVCARSALPLCGASASQATPWRPRTTGSVRARMRRSSSSEAPSAYSMSKRTISS